MKVLTLFFGMLFCAGAIALAGDKYPITLKGTIYAVNTAGKIAGSQVTHTVILRNLSEAVGLPPSDLALVYHVGGNVMGDTIDLIDRRDGRVIETLYGFYFGEAFARRALYSSNASAQRRLDYVYTRQSGVALGSAVVAKDTIRLKTGATRLVINGAMQWIVIPENGARGQTCTAKFATGPKLF